LASLLRYLVTKTLDGHSDSVKAVTIAQDVLTRGANFDPQTDSIVRVEMGRLRTALSTYYARDGASDPIIIVIDKGTYVPRFVAADAGASDRSSAAPAETQDAEDAPQERDMWRWWRRSALVIPLAMLVMAAAALLLWPRDPDLSIDRIAVLPVEFGDPALANSIAGSSLTQDIENAIQLGGLVTVVAVPSDADLSTLGYRNMAQALNARFILRSKISSYALDSGVFRKSLALSLIDGLDGAVAWNQDYAFQSDISPDEYEALVTTLGYDLRPAYHAVVKHVIEEAGLENASAAELFLVANWVPGTAVSSLAWEQDRIAIARAALEIDPDFAPAHAVLADKLAYLATVDPPSDTEANRDLAKFHASRTLSYSDQKPDVLYNILSHHLHLGNLAAAQRIAKRISGMDPNNALAKFYEESMLLTCQSATDAELASVLAFHESLTPRNPVRWITAHWIARIEMNRRNYEEVVRWGRESETIFQSLGAAYQLAAALVQVGEEDAAVALIDRHKENWPNLDAKHFATVVIPRRCGDFATVSQLRSDYKALAQILNAR